MTIGEKIRQYVMANQFNGTGFMLESGITALVEAEYVSKKLVRRYITARRKWNESTNCNYENAWKDIQSAIRAMEEAVNGKA